MRSHGKEAAVEFRGAVVPLLAGGRWRRVQLRPRASDPRSSPSGMSGLVGWLVMVAGSGACRGGGRMEEGESGRVGPWACGFRNGARWGARHDASVSGHPACTFARKGPPVSVKQWARAYQPPGRFLLHLDPTPAGNPVDQNRQWQRSFPT